MTPESRRILRVGHSPDPDDAFMFYGIASGAVATDPFDVEQILEDIESLNHRAVGRELEVSAISIHAYPYVADGYALMPCGASMGDGYGPCVVARSRMTRADLARATVAVPGTLTSAFLALRIFLGREFPYVVVPFDRILETVAEGKADAGLIIHEGQLTYGRHDLELVVDLGVWWGERTEGLPLPLGGNVVRRDLGTEGMLRAVHILKGSIEYGLDHRQEALDYAMEFGRGLDRGLADRFVGMYVNELTRDYGERGRRAIERFLEEGRSAGMFASDVVVDFVG